MSIIADALKRLQTQSEEPPPTPKPDMSSRPVFNKGEGAGRHRKDSPFKFLMVMVGMTITLGGLAVAAFWMGGHLDFGLATNTQAHGNAPLMLTNGPGFIKDPVDVDQSPETSVTAVPSALSPPKPIDPTITEPLRKPENLNLAKGTTPVLPLGEVSKPSPTETETHGFSSTQPRTSGSSPEPSTVSQTEDQSADSSEPLSIVSLDGSEKPPSTMSASPLETAPSKLSDSGMSVAGHSSETESPDMVALSLDEEVIKTEVFAISTHPDQDAPPHTGTLAALEAPRKSPDTVRLPATIPEQPTQANRLRHAQGLIRSGEYEDAVALLSPLFHEPPVQWQPWFWMGTALLGKGDAEQADQFFLSGLARNDKVPQLWIQRALVAQQRGDYQLAIYELRQAETLEADLPHIHLNMGYAYDQLGNARLALQYYEKFLKFSEDQPAFFATRKKLFARLTQQTPAEHPQPLPSSIP